LDFHHYKDLEVDRVEMGDRLVEIQEEIVVKEIVVQEDQMMGLDTEVQEIVVQEIVDQEDQMMEQDMEDQDQDLVEQKVDLV
jgi:hypothetical protein